MAAILWRPQCVNIGIWSPTIHICTCKWIKKYPPYIVCYITQYVNSGLPQGSALGRFYFLYSAMIFHNILRMGWPSRLVLNVCILQSAQQYREKCYLGNTSFSFNCVKNIPLVFEEHAPRNTDYHSPVASWSNARCVTMYFFKYMAAITYDKWHAWRQSHDEFWYRSRRDCILFNMFSPSIRGQHSSS